jgi:hypothetical protein
MGFSSASAPEGAAPGSVHMSFGDRLLNGLGQANPIANLIGGKIFGEHKLGTYNQGNPGVTADIFSQSQPSPNPMPALAAMKSQAAPLSDFTHKYEQVPEGSGLGNLILKILSGGPA